MNQNKNQQINGYLSAASLLFCIGFIVVLTFVIEIGRTVIVSAEVSRGIELASTSGVYQYGKTLEEETKKAYKEELELASQRLAEEQEDESGEEESEEEASEQDSEDPIKEMAREELKKRMPIIKQKARSACKSKVSEVVTSNELKNIFSSCTDEEVSVKGSKKYKQLLSHLSLMNDFEITRSTTELIKIHIK